MEHAFKHLTIYIAGISIELEIVISKHIKYQAKLLCRLR